MPKRARARSAIEIRRLTTPGIYAAGDVAGLHLRVKHRDSRAWILRVVIGAKRRDIGLGAYPSVTLDEAREKARAARRQIAEGKDPVQERRQARATLIAAHGKTRTFNEAAKAVLTWKTREFRNAKHAKQWEATLETYAAPLLGSLPVASIETGHVVNVLESIWTKKTETATRVRQRIETVLDWAIASGYMTGPNPARWKGHLDKLLPHANKVRKVRHHRALAYKDLPAFMPRLREQAGLAARALEFAIVTVGRSGEVRGATWAEIDREAHLWTIPAERMKAQRAHRVPLSAAAVRVLEALPVMEGTDLVFPAARGGQLSDMTLIAVLRRMEVDAVPHGFRATFKTWATECTATPHGVIEAALAHALADKTEAAYWRGDLLAKRRDLMDAWAVYCAEETEQP